jgi:phosphoribosylformylglycinamidine synthase subunit PurQ / glutaminase
MTVGVLQFPGSNDERDAVWALQALGGDAELVWHRATSLGAVDAVVLPGGFSYGDYLRCGAIARFAPIMDAVRDFAAAGGPVLGICNGFQILCEAGLLPGALTRNEGLHFICRQQQIRVEPGNAARFLDAGADEILQIPIKHGEGRYIADRALLDQMRDKGQIVFRYIDNPNGSIDDIAGVCNEAGNVLGLMPHPEHAVDPATGFKSADGAAVLRALLKPRVTA